MNSNFFFNFVANKKDSKDIGCKYSKGPWSDCDPKTNMKTRPLSLKKDETPTGSCEKTKVLTKKCKKGKGIKTIISFNFLVD